MFIRKWAASGLSLLLSTGLLAGCALDFGGDDTSEKAEPASIKVMHYDERSFYDQYGMLFSAIHPEIEVEVVSTQSIRYEPGKDMNAEMMKFIEEQKPDVVMLNPEQYTKMAAENKLLDLEAKILEKDFQQEGLMPGMLEYLRDLSGGKLHGMVPSFHSQAIYYNKDLFVKHGIELPKDKMSWEEIFRLAAMFPTDGAKEDRVYGLKMGWAGSNFYEMANMVAVTHNLSFINPATMKVTINTDGWKKVYEIALAAWKSGAVYNERPDHSGSQSYEDHLLQDPFIAGKAAMAIDGTYMMDQIKQAQDVVKDRAIQNWDLITMPVDPANPEVSPHMSFYEIMAIPAQSSQHEAAWTFLKYIMSDEFARVTAKRRMGNLSVRTNYLKDTEGRHFEAFYSLKPVQPALYRNFEKIPQDFYMKFMGIAQQEMQGVADGKTELQDALNSLQAKGEEALIQAQAQQADQSGQTSEGSGSSGTVTTTTETANSSAAGG